MFENHLNVISYTSNIHGIELPITKVKVFFGLRKYNVKIILESLKTDGWESEYVVRLT